MQNLILLFGFHSVNTRGTEDIQTDCEPDIGAYHSVAFRSSRFIWGVPGSTAIEVEG